MPREQITHPKLMTSDEYDAIVAARTADDPPSKYGPMNDAALHVSWLPADHEAALAPGVGWVQLGVEADIEQLRFALENPNGSTSLRTFIYTPTLEDADLDQLIKVLQRARRKAFPPRS